MFFEVVTAAVVSCSGGDEPPVLVNTPHHEPASTPAIVNTTLSLSTDGGPGLVGWSDRDALQTIPLRYLVPIRSA